MANDQIFLNKTLAIIPAKGLNQLKIKIEKLLMVKPCTKYS